MPLVLKPEKRKSEIDFAVVDELADRLSCDTLFAQILYNRGLTTEEACRAYLYPDLSAWEDPFSMLNMDKLVRRIQSVQDETVTVYGDYDVDGISATAILVTALRRMGKKTAWYIPNRHREGYGLNRNALESIFSQGNTLLITVDCGIASAELIREQTALGHEIIVTDHHTIGEVLPDCPVLKPGRPGDKYANTDLCGAGIAFKIAQALLGHEADDLVDLAAVATIADVVPLRGENRLLVKKGLQSMNTSLRPCFKALLEAASLDGPVTAQTVAFGIAPRLNAAGRMADASLALEMLLSDSPQEQAEHLCALNARRQEIEKQICAMAEEQLAQTDDVREKRVLVIAGEDWDEGVIGICASRLTEKYHRPCLVFSVHGDTAKGSGRSVEGIDLYALLHEASAFLLQFGGHTMAAGMTAETAKLPALKEKLDEVIRQNADPKCFYPVCRYDAKAAVAEITLDFCRELTLLEPCGNSNSEVLLRLDRVKPGSIKKIGAQQNHLKLTLQDDTGMASAVAFHYENHDCDYFHMTAGSAVVKPEINVWQNTESVSLKIENVKESENPAPLHLAAECTGNFYRRLAVPKTGQAQIRWFEDNETLLYSLAEWAEEDIAGTIVLCDHPTYAKGAIEMLAQEVPRFDFSYAVPLNGNNGYNAMVLCAEPEQILWSRYKRVVFFDLLNTGYADALAQKAPWLEFYALKVSAKALFDDIFEEYKQFDREKMMRAYKACTDGAGKYPSFTECMKTLAMHKNLPLPLLAAASAVFTELGFLLPQEDAAGYTLCKNPAMERRSLEESKLYTSLLKAVKQESKL